MKTSCIVSSLALCALLIAPVAFAQAQPPSQAGAPPPLSRDTTVQSLARQADLHFGMATDAFSKADYDRAAEEILEGADFVEIASFRTNDSSRVVLRNVTGDLRGLATFVEAGTVTDPRALEAMFDRVNHALALAQREGAAATKEPARLARPLEAARQEVGSAAAWAEHEVRAGATWTRHEVANAYGPVRRELHAIGRRAGSGADASPFDVGA